MNEKWMVRLWIVVIILIFLGAFVWPVIKAIVESG